MIVVNYDKGFAKMSQHPAFSPDFIGAHCAPTLRPQLQEASEVFGWLMDYYAPVLGEDGKLNWTQEDRELFNQYSDLLIRCATARLPFEYPRLNAIGIAAVPGSSPQAAVQQSKHITIRLNIFDDKGELVDHSEQHNVRREDLPLLIDHDADGVRQEG